ncbi:MAG: thioredoxin fold domain-containing protein [Desulfobacterales bacterium]|nr:thioredoxin fold domain-containing protein [Desulfobacterales bacterium]
MIKRICLYTLLGVVFLTATAFGSDPQGKIHWVDFKLGRAQSKQSGKAMVIYFYSQACPSCTKMERTTWKDHRIINALNTRYTPVKVDVNKEKQIAALYKVYYLPTTWFIKPEGTPFGNRSGYIPPDLLLKIFSYLSK